MGTLLRRPAISALSTLRVAVAFLPLVVATDSAAASKAESPALPPAPRRPASVAAAPEHDAPLPRTSATKPLVAPLQDTAPSWTNYTNGDDITDLAFDGAKHELWAATTGGAVRWAADGTYAKITSANGLCANAVSAISLPGAYGVWFATLDGGLCRLDEAGPWEYVNPTNLAYLEYSVPIDAVASESSGVAWAVASDRLLKRLPGGDWERIDLPDAFLGGDSYDLQVQVERATLWLATGTAVGRRWESGQWQIWRTDDGSMPDGLQFPRLAIDAAGTVWLSALEGTTAILGENMRWRVLEWSQGGPVAADSVEGVWIAAVAYFDDVGDFADDLVASHATGDSPPVTYALPNQLEGRQVTAIAGDGAGGAWIGTDGAGLYHVTAGGEFSHRSTNDPVPDNAPVAVAFGPGGEAWMAYNSAVYSGVVRRAVDGSWKSFQMPASLAWIPPDPGGTVPSLRGIEDLAIDAGGTVWLAAEAAVSLGTNGRWALHEETGAPKSPPFSVTAGPGGSVWFGTESGVAIREESGEWRRLEGAEPRLSGEILGVAFGPDGLPSLCASDGVSRLLVDGTWRSFDIPPTSPLVSGLTGDIAVDATGRVWVTDGEAIGVFAREGALETIVAAADRELYFAGSVAADTLTGAMWVAGIRTAEDAEGFGNPYDGGLLRWQPGGFWYVVDPWRGPGTTSVNDLAIDPLSGDLLAAGAGVARRTGSGRPPEPVRTVYLPFAYTTPAASPPGGIEAAEYAIYKSVIDELYSDGYGKDLERLVILDHTTTMAMRDYDELKSDMPALQRETVEEFRARNRDKHPLAGSFGVAVPVVLLSQEEHDTIFAIGGWREFYRRYPRSQGLMAISRVGFGGDRAQGLVYLGNQSNYLAGAGWAWLLSNVGGAWEVVDQVMLWIS